MLAQARENVRDRGLPPTYMYEQAELSRMAGDRDALAEPEQLVRVIERGEGGRYSGKKSGAVVATRKGRAWVTRGTCGLVMSLQPAVI